MSVTKRPQSTPQIAQIVWNDRQVASAIGLSVKRVQALAREKRLPAFKIGKLWRFDPDTIRAWIKQESQILTK